MNDRIISAISTAAGMAAIGVVRVSGKGSIELLSSIFVPSRKFATHKMYYGHIVFDEQIIDEVMVCAFYGPKSYTAEEMVEIYAHGGMLVLSRILDVVIKRGAKLAEPGEFTKRAFLNGRINLTEAEAVMDIISSKSEAARRVSLRQLGGSLTTRINELREKILLWIAHIELSIDYPEHEDEAKNAIEILQESPAILADLINLLETASIGRILRTGIKTAIIGRPNVGKSTLLNYILSENRAIVHEMPGTTRDVLTEEVRIGNLPLLIMDTAGIRKSSNVVEQIGINKTYEAIEDADLVLYIADATIGLTGEDIENLKGINTETLVLYNKADIAAGITPENIYISAKTGFGMNTLFIKLEKMFLSGIVSTESTEIITRDRHKLLIEEALKHLEHAIDELHRGVHEDLVSISLRMAYIKLGEILGEEISDDIADKIFSEFCVGK